MVENLSVFLMTKFRATVSRLRDEILFLFLKKKSLIRSLFLYSFYSVRKTPFLGFFFAFWFYSVSLYFLYPTQNDQLQSRFRINKGQDIRHLSRSQIERPTRLMTSGNNDLLFLYTLSPFRTLGNMSLHNVPFFFRSYYVGRHFKWSLYSKILII